MIKYKEGYKYQLAEDYTVNLGFTVVTPNGLDIAEAFYTLAPMGQLTIKAGYAWDGPSGPTVDTNNFMRGSLVHDVLYQCMREGYLDPNIYKDKADRELQKICIEDGMSKARAWWVYQGLVIGGWAATRPRKGEVKEAGSA